MAARSVTITDYRTQIPGALTPDRLAWKFPAVNSTTSLGAQTSWCIVVRVVRAEDAEAAVALPYTEHDGSRIWVPIADEFFDSRPMPGLVAWTDVEFMHIGGKRRESVPTVTRTGLNIGRRSATNAFTQALRDALGQYNKQVRTASRAAATAASTPRYPPMLAKTYSEYVAKGKRLDFADGVYVQPKYDGVRAVAVYDPGAKTDPLGGNIAGVIFYSRTKLLYPGFEYIKRELFEPLDAIRRLGMRVNVSVEYARDDAGAVDGTVAGDARGGTDNSLDITREFVGDIAGAADAAGAVADGEIDHFDIAPNQLVYLDGEIYKHGVPLQDISGYARREYRNTDAILSYMIYDAFVPSQPGLKFAQRYSLLREFFDTYGPFEHCALVPTQRVRDAAQIDAQYRHHVGDGYEGAMIRQNAPYVHSDGGLHCWKLLKLKPTFDAEFRVVGYTVGTRGKAAKAVMFVCETADGVRFNVTPAMEIEERNKLAAKMATVVETVDGKPVTYFEKNYLGKMLIVKFDEWSRNRVPQRARTEGVVRTWE
jgi:ATP-dependent DNA ligase